MSTPICLIVDVMHESLFAMLDGIGWSYDYRPDITREEIKKILHGYHGIIVRSKTTVDRDLTGDVPTIRFIGRAGAGVDNVDVDFFEGKGVRVLHAAEGNRDAVGEYTLGALLALMRNIPRADQEVKAFTWHREENRGEELMGKTVAIVGYGNMGRAFARRLAGFECKVLVFDKYKSDIGDTFVISAGMEQIFSEADIVSLHVPLTAETRHMVDESFLKRFKKRIILVNTSRGEVVSLQSVAKMMASGIVRGAVLDVLENEKLSTLTPEQRQSFDSLRERSNVILTPHIAGWTFESHVKINVAGTVYQYAVTVGGDVERKWRMAETNVADGPAVCTDFAA